MPYCIRLRRHKDLTYFWDLSELTSTIQLYYACHKLKKMNCQLCDQGQ